MIVGVIGDGTLALLTNIILNDRNINTINYYCPIDDNINLQLNYNFNYARSMIVNSTSTCNNFQDFLDMSDVILIAMDNIETRKRTSLSNNILNIAKQIGSYINSYKLIVIKNLIPIGTCKKIKFILNYELKQRNSSAKYDIVYNPEMYFDYDSYIDIFEDVLNPTNVIVGIDNQKPTADIMNLLNHIYDLNSVQNFKVMGIDASEIYAYYS